jgi:hypothetical protein
MGIDTAGMGFADGDKAPRRLERRVRALLRAAILARDAAGSPPLATRGNADSADWI